MQVKSSITIDYLNPQQKSTSCRLTGLGMCVCPNLQFVCFASSQHPMHLPTSNFILGGGGEINVAVILLPTSASETHGAR